MNLMPSAITVPNQSEGKSFIFERPYMINAPQSGSVPVLMASPHSGHIYPDHLTDALKVDLLKVRRIEDAYVNELYDHAPKYGATLIAARYARAVTDLNRDANELDPDMFSDGPPRPCGTPTARVAAGLGCFPRIAAGGEQIYARKLTRAEGEARLSQIHDKYHERVQLELQSMRLRHGVAVLIDCHSMPSKQPSQRDLPDIILGDRFGSSCNSKLTGRVERAFKASGLRVTRNAPYAGGFTTRRYGRPKTGIHALQIEINRSLYMDEETLELHEGFNELKDVLIYVTTEISDIASRLKRF